MFCIGILVGISYGIAEQQVLFAERVGVLALDGDVRVARLPDASVVQIDNSFPKTYFVNKGTILWP
jgi:hypothetical protein